MSNSFNVTIVRREGNDSPFSPPQPTATFVDHESGEDDHYPPSIPFITSSLDNKYCTRETLSHYHDCYHDYRDYDHDNGYDDDDDEYDLGKYFFSRTNAEGAKV